MTKAVSTKKNENNIDKKNIAKTIPTKNEKWRIQIGKKIKKNSRRNFQKIRVLEKRTAKKNIHKNTAGISPKTRNGENNTDKKHTEKWR